MVELDLNSDTVRQIINLALEFHTQDDVTFDEEPAVADEFWSGQMVQNFAGDSYYQELKRVIDDLEPDQQMSLVALMWLGRGDFSADEWELALKGAEESWSDHTADYLIGTPLLPDYLGDGLQQFEAADTD
ncbi:MAG: DUF3775 domain-containing protein [Woeseiaceae bacterium]